MIGKILGNRYQIIEKIGDGGTAYVYKGMDNLLNRHVTVKVLRPEYVSDQDFVRRFRREAQAAASLSHPNIVSIYDVGFENGIHYIVMEYIHGQSLKAVIEQLGQLPVKMAMEYAMLIALALGNAHKHGIIHRDVKPHNILISEDGRVKVTDFGIAQAVTASTVTYNGAILGSVHYFSPEQARGSLTEEKSDIYSLGIVLYEMLTGKVPFSGESPVSIAVKHLQEPFPDPQELNPQIPDTVNRIIQKAVEKEPQDRFHTVKEMADEVSQWLQGKESLLSTMDRPIVTGGKKIEPALKKAKRKLKPIHLVVIVIVILMLLLFTFGIIRLVSTLTVPEVDVPSVEGETWQNAELILETAGLNPRLERQQPSDTIPVGHVISQNPEAGRSVKKNREIALIVSTGPELIQVDNVVGRRSREATFILEDSQFKVIIDQIFSEEPLDIVISQDPAGGYSIPKGSPVTLRVSKGSEPIELIDMKGRTRQDIEAWMQLFGLNLRRISDDFSDEYPAGVVISQFPAAGEMVQAGDNVDIVISKGSEKPPLERRPITISTEGIPFGEEITVIIRDDTGERTEKYTNSGNPITTFGWGKGIVEVRWGSSTETKTFP